MLWRGISIEPQWVVLALLLIALGLGRGRQFLVDWLPFLVLFFAYEVMRGFAAKTGFQPHDLSGFERALFGGRLPTVELQKAFYRSDTIGLQDWVAMVFYFMHFPLPIVVGFFFWVNSREHYWRFVSALLLMAFLAFVTYLFWPSAPPWWQDRPEVHKVIDETLEKWGVDYYVSPVYLSLNPNKFAAFPSLHAAFPALAAFYAGRRYRVLALILVAWSACVWLSIVYLGEHYFVDALDGLLYVLAAVLLAEWLAGRWARRSAGSTPARPSS